MIRVSKLIVVDGEEMNLSAEGGSAKEALAIVDHAAEELGAAPRAAALAKNGATRTRRTKAEIEAAKAAQEKQENAPQPPGAEPARVFGAPARNVPVGPEHATHPVVQSTPVPPGTHPVVQSTPVPPGTHPAVALAQSHVGLPPGHGYTLPPGTQTVLPPDGAQTSFAPGPAAPPQERSVAFDGPPPPAFDQPSPPPPPMQTQSEEDMLRERISAVVNETIALKPDWRTPINEAMQKHAVRHGGDVYRMTAEQLRAVLKGVEDYQTAVRDALRGQPR